MTHKKYFPALIAGVVFFLLIIIAVRLGKGDTSASPEDTAAINQGVAYLQSLEAQDPDTVDATLKQQRLQRLQELRDERLRQLESGEISVWSLFDDYVLLGDSRAVGFSFYQFLPDDRVLATSGATIAKVQELLPQVVALNPSTIFMIYGINDICCGTWHDGGSYAKDYSDVVAQIHAQLPDANVYISSILPAHSASFQQYDIDGFNEAVKNMCEQTPKCYYVDNTEISEKYAYMWEVDGIHVNQNFYPHWAANLITEVYSVSLGDGTEDSGNAGTAADTTSNAAADTNTDTDTDPTS